MKNQSVIEKETNKQREYLIRLPEVKQRTGLSRSTIYAKLAKNEFPKSIPLGERAIAWRQSDIDQWIDERIEAAQHVQP